MPVTNTTELNVKMSEAYDAARTAARNAREKAGEVVEDQATTFADYTKDVMSSSWNGIKTDINEAIIDGKEAALDASELNTTYVPGIGQIHNAESFLQSNPLESKYSPRLFGAPPQLTSLCDMRLDSQYDNHEGDTGDWYRNKVLKRAQVANFFVGRALYTGGFNTVANAIRQVIAYQKAMQLYDIFGTNNQQVSTGRSSIAASISAEQEGVDAINAEDTARRASQAVSATTTTDPTETTSDTDSVTASGTGSDTNATTDAISGMSGNLDLETALTEEDANARNPIVSRADWLAANGNSATETYGLEEGTTIIDMNQLEHGDMFTTAANNLVGIFGTASMLLTPFRASFEIGQPFYTFEADWQTYINNVKMMINAAVVMLGLQSAKVKIGDKVYPIGMNAKYNKDSDVWTNYRYITPDEGIGTVTSIDNLKGETSQYVSFMVDTCAPTESYTNNTTESKIFTTMKTGNDVGTEIAFITNSSANVVDDAVIKLAGGAVSAAESVLNTLTFGAGKFVTGTLGAMARSYVGDHPVYPKIFSEHTSNTSMGVTVKLRASRGDPYTYLTDVLVPLFHILGMVLPKMSQYTSGAYQYPPLIQCQIPGIWGTRLGIVQSVSVNKNPDSTGLSVNGYPLSINVTITIEDLCHTMVTTGMDQPAFFLNNHTMFDYIAQCTGVDKYRTNSAARMVTRLALSASYGENVFYNLGSALANDITTLVNKHTRISDL